MLMLKIKNVKDFMNTLLKSETFDAFESRSISLVTYISFDIDCRIKKSFFPEEKKELIKRDFCLWKDMRPVIFELIKGNNLPLSFKIILSVKPSLAEEIHKNARALFININFDREGLSLTSGSAQKEFSLSKEEDPLWDAYLKNFLSKNGILYSEE
ncbi:MAG: DUF5721 family protein [Lachnospiraceae bacterium]|nr:DUF5721 family protein [Lachnospiraceae bacterium]